LDAGDFVLNMQVKDPAGWESFAAERTASWDAPLRQPIHRIVEGLLMLMIHTVEGDTQYADDMKITRAEAAAFDTKR